MKSALSVTQRRKQSQCTSTATRNLPSVMGILRYHCKQPSQPVGLAGQIIPVNRICVPYWYARALGLSPVRAVQGSVLDGLA